MQLLLDYRYNFILFLEFLMSLNFLLKISFEGCIIFQNTCVSILLRARSVFLVFYYYECNSG